MENKQADKMRSLQDFAFSLGEENGNGEDLTLIDDAPAEKPKTNVIDFGAGAPNNSRSSIQSSAAAYRDMNRQLGSFYETPKEDKEKEELKRQVEELTPGSMRKKVYERTERAKRTTATGTDCTGRTVRTCSGQRKCHTCKIGIGQDGFRIAAAHEQRRICRRIQQATQLRV